MQSNIQTYIIKSKLDSKRLYNAKVSFANPTDLENKKTNDRLLKHDLLFHDMFVNDDWKKILKLNSKMRHFQRNL